MKRLMAKLLELQGATGDKMDLKGVFGDLM
jgi:hypothetical protein